MSAPAQVVVQGTVAPGFEAVREEFQRNFAQRGELGAACAVYRRGQCVVDLWGGHPQSRHWGTLRERYPGAGVFLDQGPLLYGGRGGPFTGPVRLR